MKNIKKIFDLSRKVVVIIGAAGLLGTQYAEAFCQAGAYVVLADKEFLKSKKLGKKLEQKYGNVIMPIIVDLTSKKSIQSMTSKIVKKFIRECGSTVEWPC